jgi:[acyl-carrier-protein] S-malonyltransferase
MALAERHANVAAWYRRAEEASGLPLGRLLREGPDEDLQKTEYLQPALLTVEIGAWLALRESVELEIAAAAGHSLGEYAALVAAGALEPEAAVALVRRRGLYMQEAVPLGVGAMAAVVGLDAGPVAACCAQASDGETRVWLSNDNSPGQVVVSGHRAAVERATPLLTQAGARRVIPLKVSAPFHCPLMQPAADRLARDLAQLAIRDPAFPVFANCRAEAYRDAADVRAGLLAQVVQPVRFRESLQRMAEASPRAMIEVGPGTVLTGLARRTIPDMLVYQVSTPEQIDAMKKGIA